MTVEEAVPGRSWPGGVRILLILISGPPRAGKNHAGECLGKWLEGDNFSLSRHLKLLTHEHYGIAADDSEFHFESRKDEPCQEFGGRTPRQAYIDYSERILKPRLGAGYLGQIACQRIARNCASNRPSIVTGVGFMAEVSPLIATAGEDVSLHLRLAHPDGLAADDSRETLDLSSLGVPTIDLVNICCDQLVNDLGNAIKKVCKA